MDGILRKLASNFSNCLFLKFHIRGVHDGKKIHVNEKHSRKLYNEWKSKELGHRPLDKSFAKVLEWMII